MTTSDIQSLRKSMIVTIISVLMPFLLAITGILIRDHYKLAELDKYKVSKDYFDNTWFSYQLLIESKTLALETLSSSHTLDIAEIKEEIKNIQQANQQILMEIARINQHRGGTIGSSTSDTTN